MHTAKYLDVEGSPKTVILTYASKQKP